jgi:hypothetical protein
MARQLHNCLLRRLLIMRFSQTVNDSPPKPLRVRVAEQSLQAGVA